MSPLAQAILLAVLSCTVAFGQQHNAAQHVIVNLPDNVNSEDVFIRYQIITDKGSDGDLVKRSPGVRQYVLSVASSIGGTPEIANIVMYSPGCQFKIYVLDVRGRSQR
jgi:hypothetical protein